VLQILYMYCICCTNRYYVGVYLWVFPAAISGAEVEVVNVSRRAFARLPIFRQRRLDPILKQTKEEEEEST
jgi:hypothetical protein